MAKKLKRPLQFVARSPGEPDIRIPAEQWMLQILKQKVFVASRRHDPDATEDNVIAAIKAEKWLRDLMKQHADLLREKMLRTKQTVTDAQIIAALEKCGTQEAAAAMLGIDARQIRNRLPKKTRRITKKRKS